MKTRLSSEQVLVDDRCPFGPVITGCGFTGLRSVPWLRLHLILANANVSRMRLVLPVKSLLLQTA